ncbi:MAG: hypothetical protein HWD61_08910 [Parachlamydiaceae bacterium]|nr:MAG: hypothetical protein HWD61_08910 [Parachlamydiaceae bacterium]
MSKKTSVRAQQILQRVGIVGGMFLGLTLLTGFLVSPLMVPIVLVAAGVSGIIALGVALGLAVITAPFDCLLAALGKGGNAQHLRFPDGAVDKAKKACNQNIEEMKKLESYKQHFSEETFVLFIQSNPWFHQLSSLKHLQDFYQLYKTHLQIQACKNKIEEGKQALNDAENESTNEIQAKERFAALGKELKERKLNSSNCSKATRRLNSLWSIK